jgi:hypothetical protein
MEKEVTKPDKPIARRYLGDAQYPANQQELVSATPGNGAPRAFVETSPN